MSAASADILWNDETIISSISVTDIFFDVYLGKWNYRAIPKVKTWSYFLTIPMEDEPQGNCPICGAPASKFEKID